MKLKRPNIKGKKPKKKKKQKLLPILILLCTILCVFFFYYQFEKSIMPSVLSMAQFKAKTIATSVINEAVKEVIEEYGISSKDLVHYVVDGDGSITSAQVNTIVINTITSDVNKKIDENFDKIGVYHLEVPLGNLTGSDLLANYGPVIDVMIMPIGTATINYDREFKATGINQINHRVWLDIQAEIQIVVPMATEQIYINQKFVLVDQLIEGEVPPNYVNVPESNILDVTPDPTIEQ